MTSFFVVEKIEEIYCDHNVLHAILLSNIKLTSKFFKGIFPLRSLHPSFSLLQNSNITNCKNSDTFLRFNNHLKYKGKPLYNKEFSDAGIIDAEQLVDSNGNFLSYDYIASAYKLTPNNESFIEYIKLMSAVPENWNFKSAFIDNRNEIIENILEKLQSFRKSSRCNLLENPQDYAIIFCFQN